jgi:hypothetical protein
MRTRCVPILSLAALVLTAAPPLRQAEAEPAPPPTERFVLEVESVTVDGAPVADLAPYQRLTRVIQASYQGQIFVIGASSADNSRSWEEWRHVAR